MVKRLLGKFMPIKPQRALLLLFAHPDLGRCVLHHPDAAHMLLAKGDVAVTAARFYLKPYFKYLSSIDLHHYHHTFVSGGTEYDIVGFEFPVVCDKGRALGKLVRDRHQFIPIEQHPMADKLNKNIH